MKPPDQRALAGFIHDIVAMVFAWLVANWLWLNLQAGAPSLLNAQIGGLWIVPVQILVFWRMRLYQIIWRYFGIPDFRRLFMACAFSAAIGLAISLAISLAITLTTNLATGTIASQAAVIALDSLLLLLFSAANRLAFRVWKESAPAGANSGLLKPVLILGAGDAGADLLKHLTRSKEWRVAGLLDDNAAKHGRQILGCPVLGSLASLPRFASELSITQAIIALPGQSHAARRRAMEICTHAGVSVMTVPSYDDIMSGKITVSQIRKVELDDLLGRDPVILDGAGLREWISERTIMVTGAGGSIGAELCRQIERFAPSRLLFLDSNELALYNLEQEFLRHCPGRRIACAIGDVKDGTRLATLMRQYRPAVVFHAAAYKHVPLMEELNAWEAVRNNVAGTLAVAKAAIDHGVEKFVLISTDKAVNPTNVMGASKRLAELVCHSLNSAATRFVVVRFGNVLGSTGSVIPKFREQIARGGPITVTHPDITRYFMSIPEAAQLVLQAGLMGQGGEIFVLDMGDPVKIVDLARDLIRLSGFSEQDIRIEFTGLRAGEKLYEELLADSEQTLPTPHPKLRIAKSNAHPDAAWRDDLLRWLEQPAQQADSAVRARLKALVPEYSPHSTSADSGAD